MTAIVNSRRRSEMMVGIKGRDTEPELVARRIAHKLGLPFRLRQKDLTGRYRSRPSTSSVGGGSAQQR